MKKISKWNYVSVLEIEMFVGKKRFKGYLNEVEK